MSELGDGEGISFSDLCDKIRCPGLTCAVICLLVISLSGCVRATPTPEPVTITFAYENIQRWYYEPLVQQFNERHPHITVELRPWAWPRGPDYSADVNVAFSLNALSLQEQGEISMLSLDSLVQQDGSFSLSDLYAGTVGFFTSGGETWGIPTGIDVGVMYYDQELFDQYGIPYPEIGWTWDDFLNVALALRDPAADVFGYAMNRPSFGDYLYFVYPHGGRLVDDLQNTTRPTFDDPLTVEALEWYADLMYEHNVAPTPEQARTLFCCSSQTAPIGAVDIGIVNGKVGMWMGRFSERGGVRYFSGGKWHRRWGMTTVPQDARSATLAWGEGLFISSQAQDPNACWQWITFLGEQVPYSLIPARKSLVESAAYDQLVGDDIATVVRASLESALPVYYKFYQVRGIFDEAAATIVDGDLTPREAMDRAQREALSAMAPQ